jgi:hypothetical protein
MNRSSTLAKTPTYNTRSQGEKISDSASTAITHHTTTYNHTLPRSLIPLSHLSLPYQPWPPQNAMSKLPLVQPSRQRHQTAIRLWTMQSHDTTVEVSPPSWPPYNRLVNACLTSFTWHSPRPSPFDCVTATFNPPLSLHGYLRLTPHLHHGRCTSTVHTFSGCSDSACSTSTTIAQGDSQIQNHHPQSCATPRTMHSHHHESTAWRQHMPNVWQSPEHRLALCLPPGLAS